MLVAAVNLAEDILKVREVQDPAVLTVHDRAVLEREVHDHHANVLPVSIIKIDRLPVVLARAVHVLTDRVPFVHQKNDGALHHRLARIRDRLVQCELGHILKK